MQIFGLITNITEPKLFTQNHIVSISMYYLRLICTEMTNLPIATAQLRLKYENTSATLPIEKDRTKDHSTLASYMIRSQTWKNFDLASNIPINSYYDIHRKINR